jgi:predicted dehydrogenase
LKTIRIGIAGTGFAGKFHFENMPESGVEVAGVTSARAESREAFARKHGVRAFGRPG